MLFGGVNASVAFSASTAVQRSCHSRHEVGRQIIGHYAFRWMTLWAEDGEVGVVLASEMAIVAMVDV